MKKLYLKRLKKTFIVSILIFCVFGSSKAFAETSDSNNVIESVTDEKLDNQLTDLYNYINHMKLDIEILNDLDPVEYIKSYVKNGEGTISVGKITNAIISFVFKEVKTALSLSVSIIIIAIICSLIKNLQASFSNENIANIAFYACYSILIILLTKSFVVSINIAIDIIDRLAEFMAALLPVLVMMIASIGGFSQAATMDPIILGATIIIPRIYKTVIIPIILVSFVLQFTNNISTEYKISNLAKMARQASLWLQGIILALFIGLLTVRGITSSTLDAVTLKTAKFAVDNFIPIVGKAFSDAIASVAGYSLIIKNAVSTIGLVIIIIMMLYPIIKIFLISFVYKLSAAVIEPISDKRITSAIVSAADSLVLLMSCILSVSLMFFVLLAIIASAGKFVVGG